MSYDLRIERLLDGTPDEIFDTFVDPVAIKEWYQLRSDWEVAVLSCDARTGGTTSVEFGSPNEGWKCREDMTYTVVERPGKLAYNQVFTSGDESYHTVVTFTFEPQDSKTLLTLVETGYPNAEERDAHENGWPGFIDRLEQVAIARRA
jgi:uncharacterized protein YndB with AHSA1/START domain